MKEITEALKCYKKFLDKCELVENKARQCMYQAGLDYNRLNCSYFPGDGLCIELDLDDRDDYVIPCSLFFSFFEEAPEVDLYNLKRISI